MSGTDLIIAVDGYSSTGKSSFAKKIAKAYGLVYLDSGAIYRAVTLFALENGLIKGKVPDFDALHRQLPSLEVSFRTVSDGTSHCFISDRDVESDIRSMSVSGNVSPVSTDPVVRNFVDGILRSYGRAGGVTMDGRDIGTTVFPNAGLKIFMTARPEVRAQRRLDEFRQKGLECDFAQVLENIKERDRIDSSREVSPLRRADDAIVLDNSDMTIEQEMQWIAGILEKKFNLRPVSDES